MAINLLNDSISQRGFNMQAKGFYDKPIEPFDAISQYETRNN